MCVYVIWYVCVPAANTFSGNRSSVYSLCMDPAGKLLASGSSDKVRHGFMRGGRGSLPYLVMNICDMYVYEIGKPFNQ